MLVILIGVLDLTAVHRPNWVEWANAHIQWRLALWRGVLFTDESRFSLCRADWQTASIASCEWVVCWCQRCGSSGPWWCVGLWYRAGICYGQWNTGAFYWWHFECTEIPWRDPEAHCCAFIHNHHLMLQHDNAQPHMARICTQFPGSWKQDQFLHDILTRHFNHWACFGMLWIRVYDSVSRSCQYPATLQSHWRGVDQHSTGHNQQPDKLYVKDMCCTAWGKKVVTPDTDWFSDPLQYSKSAHFKVAFYCGQPKAHLCNNHAV